MKNMTRNSLALLLLCVPGLAYSSSTPSTIFPEASSEEFQRSQATPRQQNATRSGKNGAQSRGQRQNAGKQRGQNQRAQNQRAQNQRANNQRSQRSQQTNPTRRSAAESRRAVNARSQSQESLEQRIANARRQRAARIGSAAREMPAAQKAQRIANARRQFAAFNPQQTAAARRYMAAQNAHNDRMARLQRIEDLLERRGDEANLARVRSLRARQMAQRDRDRAALRTVLDAEQASAVEDTVEIGTRSSRRDNQ